MVPDLWLIGKSAVAILPGIKQNSWSAEWCVRSDKILSLLNDTNRHLCTSIVNRRPGYYSKHWLYSIYLVRWKSLCNYTTSNNIIVLMFQPPSFNIMAYATCGMYSDKPCHCTVSLNKSMSECKQVPTVGAEWHVAHLVLRICTDAQYLLVVTYHNWAASSIHVTHNTFHLRVFYNVGWSWCGRKQLCSTLCTTTVVVSRHWGKLNKLNQVCVCVCVICSTQQAQC